MKTASLSIAFVAVASLALAGSGQQSAAPVVAATGLPMYPEIARVARVSGVVHVRIRTDGTRVVSAEATDGAPLLVQEAEQNALTWRFQMHAPAEYTLTYTYRLDEELPAGELAVRLRHPLQVEVIAGPIFLRDPPHDPIH